MSYSDLALRIFLQLSVILASCYVLGRIGRKLGQSQVVCEMVAGVLLGPSLLGLLAPGVQQWLFPKVATITVGHTSVAITHPSMSILYTVSQIGLAIYMFLVGLEFETKFLRGRGKSVGLIAGSGIAVPFMLGIGITPLLFQHTGLFGPGITVWMAGLFIGATLAITAFPMLARMLQEYHLSTTKLGTITLVAASIDDVSCWCLLAIILATYKSSALIALLAVGGGIVYVAGMLTVGRRILGIYTKRTEQMQTITHQALIVVLLILMLSSWLTLAIGIYQVFGAFIVGVAVPRGRLSEEIRKQFDPLTTNVLLPIFFVFSGLNTQIGLVNTPTLWLLTGLIFLVAIIGKFGGCTLAARIAGESWRESAALGTLMNSRGLIELIMLNIGLQEHIITPTLFTILVIMAIVTTLFASPVFEWMYGRIDPLWKVEFYNKRRVA
jgi:Kef-type K+ transport system membrane component KefB